jgi:hypothetical protein
MTKLDLGAGPQSPEGFLPMGNAHGSQIFPLPAFADNSVDVSAPATFWNTSRTARSPT